MQTQLSIKSHHSVIPYNISFFEHIQHECMILFMTSFTWATEVCPSRLGAECFGYIERFKSTHTCNLQPPVKLSDMVLN